LAISSLVRSKILVPSPAALLHRPRLYREIERGLERKVTLVTAPAGYGKTSSLVDFACHTAATVCWYTADERDRDLATFVEYLVGAIAERFPCFGERTRPAIASLGGDLFRDPAAAVGELANEMLDLSSEFVLVVDNYEALSGALGIREFILRLIEVMPPNCHLALGSRVLPDVPITRLVARQQLVGLSGQDLRFDAREIEELLRLSGVEVSAAQAEVLAVRSEGWITGVLLLADRVRGAAAQTLRGIDRATADMYDYLAQDVLSAQPPDLQDFLSASAVLREMSARLCHEALDMPASRSLLREVERRHLFITRFGVGDAATYRYHNLFRDFLHERLHERDPARYVELHQRAARWFEDNDDVEEAVYHYLEGDVLPRAIVLMERVVREWFTRGRSETLLRWAEALPEESRRQAPWLSYYQGRALTDHYRYDEAERALAHAEAGFTARGEAAHLARVHNQRAVLAVLQNRYEDAIEEAQAALGMLGQEDRMERAEARRLIGEAEVALGRFSVGVRELKEALALFREAGSPYDVVILLQDLTLAATSRGRFDDAVAWLNEALAVGQRLGAPTLLAGVLNNLGSLHSVRGEYRQALRLYEEGLATARRGGDPRWQAYNLIGMADLYRDIGAYGRAEASYRAAWQFTQQNEPGVAVYILMAQADMYRWQGDPGRARVLLRRARALAEERGLESETLGLLPVAEGIALVEGGDIGQGCSLLANGIRFLEQRQAKLDLVRARFLLARAHLLAQEQEAAVRQLRQALHLADEIAVYQPLIAEGQHAEHLLDLGVARGVARCSVVLEKIAAVRALAEELGQDEAEAVGELVSRLEVYTLGEMRVVRDGQVVASSDWQGAKSKEMFFYILLHGPVERDVIGLVLWPDLTPRQMRNNFHSTLYRVRRAVGADAVVMEDGRYRLGDVDCWLDVREFERAVERARLLPYGDWQAERLWRRAVSLYRGDFLLEVDREWVLPRREALRMMYLEALMGVGRCHETRREYEAAVDWYRRALRVDELREDIHRRLMECFDQVGRRSDALAQYDACRDILERELGVMPSEETERLYERVAGRRPA